MNAEVVDLTHPLNVTLLRQWEDVNFELPYIEQLRFVRINSENPQNVVVSRRGKNVFLMDQAKDEEAKAEVPMLIDHEPSTSKAS